MSAGRGGAAHAWRGIAAPFVLVAAMLIATLVLGMLWASHRTDALALETQKELLRNAVNVQLDRTLAQVGSELQWDDAVASLVNEFDPGWADSHLADWLHSMLGIEHVVVFDPDDHAIYFSSDGKRANIADWHTVGFDAAVAVSAIRTRELQRGNLWRPGPDFDTTLSVPIDRVELQMLNGHAAIVTSTLVQPDFGRTLPRGPRSAIVIAVKRIDQRLLDAIGEVIKFQDLRLESTPLANTRRGSIPIEAGNGSPVAWVSWRPDRPGRALLFDALPFLIGACVGLIALLVAALVRIRSFHQQVQVAETTAVRQAELLERMSELGEIGAWELEPDTNTLRYSRHALQMSGLEPNSPITPESSAALYTGDSFERLNQALHAAITKFKSFDLILQMRSARGHQRTVRMQGSPVIEASRCILVSGTAQDITEQVQREHALKLQTELLERMARIADVGAWEYVIATRALNFTAHVHRIYGFDPGVELSLETVAALYTPADREEIIRVLERGVKTGAPWDLEMSPTTPDGRSIWVRTVGETEWADGKPVRLIGTLRDVTRERAAVTALSRAMNDLRARNSDLQEFTSAASHDLQEPVRKVQALGSLIVERFGATLDPVAIDYLARMRAAAGRMGTLIEDLLSYSRVSAKPGRAVQVALDAIAREVVDDLDTLVDRTNGVVHIGDLPVIEADPTQIRQLFQNLIGNGLKYRHPHRPPEVWVGGELLRPTDARVEQCRITVRDNGIGFDNAFAETIFAPFRRLHDRSIYDGTGMGLAIVRRIVDWHHGRVTARGEEGCGSCFVVELPVRQPHVGDEHGASAAPE